jgi:hypothetical protein
MNYIVYLYCIPIAAVYTNTVGTKYTHTDIILVLGCTSIHVNSTYTVLQEYTTNNIVYKYN